MLILIVPLVFYLGALFKQDVLVTPFPFASVTAYVSALFFMAIKGPIEEIGWRGLALPMLQRQMAPMWAALVLGVVWAVWHLPAFMLGSTPQSAWALTPFLVGTLALSVIVAPLFNHSRMLSASIGKSFVGALCIALAIEGRLHWHPAVEWTGGGLVSTSRDLVRWGAALFAGEAMACGNHAALDKGHCHESH